MFWLALASSLAVNTAVAAETKPPKPEEPKKTEAPVEPPKPRTEPFSITLPASTPSALICQPRDAQCVRCNADDPCYVYQSAQRPVK